jgi:hypothetical protein
MVSSLLLAEAAAIFLAGNGFSAPDVAVADRTLSIQQVPLR